MQRSLVATIVQVVLFIFFFAALVCNIMQVNDLQKQTIHQTRELDQLQTTIQQFQHTLERGALSGSEIQEYLLTGDPEIDYHARFFDADEWMALNENGNFLQPQTSRLRSSETLDGGTLRRSFISDIPGLNPLIQSSADVSELYHYVSLGLATRQRNDPDRWIPGLAYRIEVNQEYTEYHVYLRDNILWHTPAVDFTNPQYTWLEGEHELVADDFVFALSLIQNPQVEAGSQRNYYEQCDGIEVINDHEFIVHWREPTFQSIAFTVGLEPIPRWLYGADENGTPYDESNVGLHFNNHWFNQRAIGVGPYRFVRWTPGGAIVLDRWNRYFGERPPIEQIEFRIISDAPSRLNQLLVGDLDYISIEPAQFANEIEEGGTPEFESGELNYQAYQGPGYRYIGWDADGHYFNDRRVRRAMTHAFDRQTSIDHNMHGLGRLVTGSFFINGPDYDHSIEPFAFDLQRAAQLLEEAGWLDLNNDGIREKEINGQLINFEFGILTYGYRAEFIAAMQAYRNNLRRIGVIMNIEPVEWSIMSERMQNKDFDAFTGGWVLGWTADPYQIWHSSQADIPRSSNRVGFRNAEADELIERARRTFDPEERHEIFRQFHRIVHEEQPFTFWFTGMEIGGWRNGIENVTFSPLRPFDSSQDWSLAAP